jgi:hypothetical protein
MLDLPEAGVVAGPSMLRAAARGGTTFTQGITRAVAEPIDVIGDEASTAFI